MQHFIIELAIIVHCFFAALYTDRMCKGFDMLPPELKQGLKATDILIIVVYGLINFVGFAYLWIWLIKIKK